MERKKRNAAVLIPYRFEAGVPKIFLQKRTLDAPTFPDHFGFFGGGMEEGENPEQAMLRELKEELAIEVTNYHFWKTYQTDLGAIHVYTAEVSNTFEDDVEILEGQYGKFLNREEIVAEKASPYDRPIAIDFLDTLVK